MRATLIIRIGLLAAAPLLVTLAACTSGSGAGLPTAATTAAASSVTTGAATAAVSQQVLPLGDGHVGSTARVGYVDACQTSFPPGGGGAFRDGPWIHGATWDATAKLAVQGSV